MSRRSRRAGRRLPPGVRFEERKPHPSRQARHRPTADWVQRWRVPIISAAVLLLVILIGVRLWLQSEPPTPDVNALRTDIANGRNGAEVTFVATVVAAPATVGDHEQLDFNTQLGQWIPVHAGGQLTVHGQLYIDPGRVGVHCLHQQTSSGCPLPGWIQFGGRTYS